MWFGTIAMESTDGLTRGLEFWTLVVQSTFPVSKDTLGRVFNVLGDTIDLEAPLQKDAERRPIQKNANFR